MSRRQIKRAIQRKAAKQGTATLFAKVDRVSKETEQTILAEQREHAREISALMMAVPTRVLVMDMNWLPLDGGDKDKKRKLMQFAKYLMDEIERVNADEKFSIDKYVEQVYRETGVSYKYGKTD